MATGMLFECTEGLRKYRSEMINEALSKYQTIEPCAGLSSFDDCFRRYGDNMVFWFNTEDQSTRAVMRRVSC